MLQLIQLGPQEHEPTVRQLFLEYLQLFHEKLNQEHGISFDMEPILDRFMMGIHEFYPPQGRIYLANCDGQIVGVGCLKQLSEEACEIKRMFVRPEYRGRGFGKGILDQLNADARSIGYTKIYLDSPKFFTISHKMYQSRGFQSIEPYPGSEGAGIAPDLWVYMELVL